MGTIRTPADTSASIVAVLVARSLWVSDAQRESILTARDPETLERWLAKVASCPSVEALLRDS